MKIQIDDYCISGFVEEFADGVVKWTMQRIINDDTEYPHPEDKVYYDVLKKAALIILEHYSEPGECTEE